jgi:acetate kinase
VVADFSPGASVTDPDNVDAALGNIVRSDLKGSGLAGILFGAGVGENAAAVRACTLGRMAWTWAWIESPI